MSSNEANKIGGAIGGDVCAAGEISERPWERVQKARKENRPQAKDYIEKLFSGVFETKGDRCFGDDPSIITAIARFDSWGGHRDRPAKGTYARRAHAV